MSKFKVDLYVSRGAFPLWFVFHPWFVVENNGVVSRWEVVHQKYKSEKPSWGHLFKNILLPKQGIGVFVVFGRFEWQPIPLASIQGDEGSIAQRISEFIENSPNTYPYRDKYSFIGANSNTYVQWILNHFPEWKVKLPWNAFGKNYVR